MAKAEWWSSEPQLGVSCHTCYAQSYILPFQDTYAGVIVSIRMPMKRFLLSENNIKNIEEIQTNTAKNNYFFPLKYLSIKTGSIINLKTSHTHLCWGHLFFRLTLVYGMTILLSASKYERNSFMLSKSFPSGNLGKNQWFSIILLQ